MEEKLNANEKANNEKFTLLIQKIEFIESKMK